jgi:5-methylcytosine-specific restriction protein A
VTGRSVALWVGKTPDAKVPTAVRLRVFIAHGGRCHISGRVIRPGDAWDLDHIKPLHLGGAHAEANLAPALKDPHREKSAAEVTAKAKTDRIRAKHLGQWPKSPFPLRSRGFQRRDRAPSPQKEPT